jgi:uncharacterized phiE125 gp8 family phage protein
MSVNPSYAPILALEYGSTPIPWATKLITDATTEPLTTAEAKLHSRFDDDDDDTLFVKWIKAARRKVEQDTGRALPGQTHDLFLDACPSNRGPIIVPFPPLQSVTVYSTDTNGVETTLDPTNYVLDVASEPGRIGLSDAGNWPTSLRNFQPVRVRFVAGYAAVPEDLVRAMALVVGWLAAYREPEPFERNAYDALIAPYVLPVV